METILIVIFLLGYAGIVFEHKLHINKSAIALLTGASAWAALSFFSGHGSMESHLEHHLSDIAAILFFLMGAMTIVELIDTYDGFDIITSRIRATDLRTLLWIISLLTFFLSAALDNLTTTIVIVTLIRKLITQRDQRLIIVGMVVIAANAGGAWSPIGDVTTTMLWIGGQVTSINIIKMLFLPSLISLLVPLLVLSFQTKGTLPPSPSTKIKKEEHSIFEKQLVFFLGIGGLLFVPIFKTITHLPPYMGILFVLSVLWAVTELLVKNKTEEQKARLSIQRALERLDMPTVLFFLGILLAVSSLQTAGILAKAATGLASIFSSQNIIVTLIGLLSAIVDNVPLVAAAMGMYSLEQFPQDHSFWELLAYCAGTGGSVLIIGSAAGVAAMGMEKIDFFWYMKKISWLALIGYFAGIGVFMAMH